MNTQSLADKIRSRGGLIIEAVDLHCAGEPGRVVIVPTLDAGGSAAIRAFLAKAPMLRGAMLKEPRGYPATNCNLVAVDRPNAASIAILEQHEDASMSGSNVICVATALVELGAVEVCPPWTVVHLDTAAGPVEAHVLVENGRATEVRFRNVPSFMHTERIEIDVPHIGRVPISVAFGGEFYAIVPAEEIGFALTPEQARELARAGALIRAAAREQIAVSHPTLDSINEIKMVQFAGSLSGLRSKNVVVICTGEFSWDDEASWIATLDRSPCGTGTSARLALLHHLGQMRVGECLAHESITGCVFHGTILSECSIGDRRAIVPEIAGRAWITGMAQYVIEADDPFPNGFTVGDIWPIRGT